MTEEHKTDTDKAMAAMRRAANIARKRAAAHGHKIAIWRDGKVVLIDPTPIPE